MYKIVISVLLGFCGLFAFAAPWGALDDGAYQRNKPEKSLSKLVSKTLFPQLLARREPLRYCVTGSPDSEEYASWLERAYTEWFEGTANVIRQAGRSKEFADLLPFLERPLVFERQLCFRNSRVEERFQRYMDESLAQTEFASRAEQLRLVILSERAVAASCGSSLEGEAVACAGSASDFGSHVIVSADLNDGVDPAQWYASLQHEAGHTLGMGEGYVLGQAKNSPFFGSSTRQGSVMGAAAFSCDDADAMVIFADSQSVPGKPARTGQTARSFQSLCPEAPIEYVDGVQQQRPARAAGDARRFSQTSFTADGRVQNFQRFEPDAQGFASAFRLFEGGLRSGRPDASGGITYFTASDGRTFAAENMEENGYKRIFTLKDNRLLGVTFLDFSRKNGVSASTKLDLQNGKKRLMRVENIDYEPEDKYFVYALFEGMVKNGTVVDAYARLAFIFKDWMVVSVKEPGMDKVISFLLEKGSNAPQRMSVYQASAISGALGGGNFTLSLTGVKAAGNLSERDKTYLENFASSALSAASDELQRAGDSRVYHLGNTPTPANISAAEVSSLAVLALDLHSKAGRSVQNYFDGNPFAARDGKKLYAEFQKLFRPQPHSAGTGGR